MTLTDTIDQVEQLYAKAQAHKDSYNAFSDRDIRTSFFGIMVNQCGVVHLNLTINEQYLTGGSQASFDLFNGDQGRVDDYIYSLNQNANELIVEASLFQSELVFRTLNAALTGHEISDGKIPDLLVELFEDIKDHWTKEECKLFMLLSPIRNTIHTGGIYFNRRAGVTRVFKGDTYTFTYGKSPIYPAGITILDLVSELLDAMKVLFDSAKIAAIGPLEHPSYPALGR